MHPTEGELVTRHLNPDRVDGVGRNRVDISHHKMVMFSERKGVD